MNVLLAALLGVTLCMGLPTELSHRRELSGSGSGEPGSGSGPVGDMASGSGSGEVGSGSGPGSGDDGHVVGDDHVTHDDLSCDGPDHGCDEDVEVTYAPGASPFTISYAFTAAGDVSDYPEGGPVWQTLLTSFASLRPDGDTDYVTMAITPASVLITATVEMDSAADLATATATLEAIADPAALTAFLGGAVTALTVGTITTTGAVTPDEDGDSADIGPIIGGAVGGAAGVIILGGAAYMLMKKKKPPTKQTV